jgi:hypothetical protein
MIKTRSLWLTFWPGWILVNGFGWFLVNVFYLMPFFGLRVFFAVGFLLGLLQWAVLLKNDLGDSMWIWMSVIPYGIFLFILFLLASNLTLINFILLHIACLGLLGLFQRVALAYYVNHATIWIIASPLASMFSMIASPYVGNLLFGQVNTGFYWAFFGIVYGCITGAVIIFLYDSSITRQGSSENPKVIDI